MIRHGTCRSKIRLHHCRSFGSVHARAELDLLRDPLSAAAHTACAYVRTLEPSGAFSRGKTFHAVKKSSDRLLKTLRPDGATKVWRVRKKGAADYSHTSCWPCDDPIFIAPSWFSALPGLTLLWDRDQTAGETNGSIVQVTSKDTPGSKRALPLRGRDVLVQDALPLRNVVMWSFVNFKINLRVRDIHWLEELANHGLNELGVISASNIFKPVLRQGPSDRDKQALSFPA